jgi:hypothetical protein
MNFIKSIMGRRKFLAAAAMTSTAALFGVNANAAQSATIENRLAALEEANKKLEREVTLSRDIQEIQKLVGLMQQFHTGSRDIKVADYFAKKAPGVRVYFPGGGYWEGPDAPKKMGSLFSSGGKPPVGMMAIHLMANSVIEVAEDGQTAKGMWHAGGLVASTDEKTKKPSAMWEWNRYGTDFIKEDGKWCFWHHHIYPLFQIDWDEKWSERFAKTNAKAAAMELPFKVDGPPGPLDVGYDPLGNLPYIPEPQPYKTFDPKTMY